MDDVENNVAVEEIAPPETSPQEVTTESIPTINDKEENLRALRNGKKEAERRALEAERKAQAQEELIAGLLKQQMTVAPQQVADELDTIPADDYLPKGKVEKLLERSERKAEKRIEEAVKKALEDRERANFHSRLKSKFTDFDDVVTTETLELLDQHDPELAATIAKSKDPYEIGLQTYKYIKALGLGDKAPAHRRVKEVEKKIEQNSKTIQSPQAYDKRPMAQTFQMTEQLKQDLQKEMDRYASMADGVPKL